MPSLLALSSSRLQRRTIPKIGGSTVGFVVLIIFLVAIILFSLIAIMFIRRSSHTTPYRLRPRTRDRTRRHHHQSVPSTSEVFNPSTLNPTTSDMTAVTNPTTTTPSKRGWLWHAVFGGKSAKSTNKDVNGRGWVKAGSIEWDDLNANDKYKFADYRNSPSAPPTEDANANAGLHVAYEPTRPPTSTSPHYSESIISGVHFDSLPYNHGRPPSQSYNRKGSGGTEYSPVSSPSPPPRPPTQQPMLTTHLSSSPQSSPLPSPVSTPVPIPVRDGVDARSSAGGSRQDSAQSGLSVWTFQGGTKFIESL